MKNQANAAYRDDGEACGRQVDLDITILAHMSRSQPSDRQLIGKIKKLIQEHGGTDVNVYTCKGEEALEELRYIEVDLIPELCKECRPYARDVIRSHKKEYK